MGEVLDDTVSRCGRHVALQPDELEATELETARDEIAEKEKVSSRAEEEGVPRTHSMVVNCEKTSDLSV